MATLDAHRAQRLAFDQFYAASRDSVYRCVLVATRHPERADDAVHEAYTRAYADWERVSLHPNPQAWVARAAVIFQSLAQPPSAFASWTAVPGTPDPALAAIAESECLGGVQDPERLDSGSLPLVAQDQRGDIALALFSDGRTLGSCVVLRAPGGGATAVGLGTIEVQRQGALRLLSAMAHEGEPALRTLVGDVGPDVASVVIERDEGEPVRATVRAGYFLGLVAKLG